jgi:hypothetical protein
MGGRTGIGGVLWPQFKPVDSSDGRVLGGVVEPKVPGVELRVEDDLFLMFRRMLPLPLVLPMPLPLASGSGLLEGFSLRKLDLDRLRRSLRKAIASADVEL